MTSVTLVMAYYENPGMLKQHYADIAALPIKLRDALHVVIVDDGSPKSPAEPADLGGVALQIYRMEVDVRWNQDACRNIGMHHAETEWCLLTDIDHRVPEKTWAALINGTWDKETVYQFRRVSAPDMEDYKLHPNTWFMARSLYERMGGYDERFAGYYGTDGDFRDRVNANAKIKQLKDKVIRVPRAVIPDASTTTYLRKQPEDREAINQIKAQRAKAKDPSPKRFLFPYHRVYP